MMKVNLAVSKAGTAMYTASLLRHLCSLHGIPLVNERDADALWVSICDPDDLPLLIRARSIAGARPVIMGGFESYFAMPYMAWADYVVVGEGFEFIKAWGKQSPQDALSLPCVMTNELNEVYPSYEIDWKDCPLVRLAGGKRYYFLSGKGCKSKCKFCATAWTQPHATCPRPLMDRAKRALPANGSINLISNDSDILMSGLRVSSRSVRVRDYIQNPGQYRTNMIHFGVEGFTEEARKGFSKPILDNELRDLMDITKTLKQRCELFFIVNYPGFQLSDIERFVFDVLPMDPAHTPSVHVKLTYFDPSPYTPMGNVPVGRVYVDTKAIFRMMNSRNKRVRVFPVRSMARTAWRTVFHRCTPFQSKKLGRCPNDTNMAPSLNRFGSELKTKGLYSLMGDCPDNSSPLIHCKISVSKKD